MKRAISLLLILSSILLLSCQKEAKEAPYNADGSPLTMEQAIEIVQEEVDYYEEAYISKSIIKKGTKFTNSLDPTCGTYKVPYDSWIVIINTNPLANSGQFWLYIYINAHTGDDSQDAWLWGYPKEFNLKQIKCIGGTPLTPDDIFPNLSNNLNTKSLDTSVSNDWAKQLPS